MHAHVLIRYTPVRGLPSDAGPPPALHCADEEEGTGNGDLPAVDPRQPGAGRELSQRQQEDSEDAHRPHGGILQY